MRKFFSRIYPCLYLLAGSLAHAEIALDVGHTGIQQQAAAASPDPAGPATYSNDELLAEVQKLYKIPVLCLACSEHREEAARKLLLAAIAKAKDYSKTPIKELVLIDSGPNSGLDNRGQVFANPVEQDFDSFLFTNTGTEVKKLMEKLDRYKASVEKLYGTDVRVFCQNLDEIKKAVFILQELIGHAPVYQQHPEVLDSLRYSKFSRTLWINPDAELNNIDQFLNASAEMMKQAEKDHS